jgi:hypothetical protein
VAFSPFRIIPKVSVLTNLQLNHLLWKLLANPKIFDKGLENMTLDWYDAEGFGCLNNCRWVGDSLNVWFSCIRVDPMGTTTSPELYTPLGTNTESGLADKKCDFEFVLCVVSL